MGGWRTHSQLWLNITGRRNWFFMDATLKPTLYWIFGAELWKGWLPISTQWLGSLIGLPKNICCRNSVPGNSWTGVIRGLSLKILSLIKSIPIVVWVWPYPIALVIGPRWCWNMPNASLLLTLERMPAAA